MAVVWCDTETTGISPANSGIFQVAFLGVVIDDGKKVVHERMFMFNPLGGEIVYSGGTGKIHGYTEADILELPPEKEIVDNIVRFLLQLMTNFGRNPAEKLDFCGYNPKFDYEHLTATFRRCGYDIEDYFTGTLHDVMSQAKQAVRKGIIDRLDNLKLTTVAKSLNVDMKNAHDAMCDIKATRKVSGIFATKGVKFT